MNRKYLVDTSTHEYICIALHSGKDWKPNNQGFLQEFMDSRPNKAEEGENADIITGEYNDNKFFQTWIRNGTNFVVK